MVKFCGHWIPCILGWLPDKTEESYRVFILLVKKALKELGLSMDVKSVIMDFEIAMLKAVDGMVEGDIESCFFNILSH